MVSENHLLSFIFFSCLAFFPSPCIAHGLLIVSGCGHVSSEYGQMEVPPLGSERGQGSFWLLVLGVSSEQCYCWDDSFFLPVGLIHLGYAVNYAGMQQRLVWNSQTLGKGLAGPCRSTFWSLVCRDWILCWRWVPVTAAHWGAAQNCITIYAGGTSGIGLLHPYFVKVRPTSVLAQVSQKLST